MKNETKNSIMCILMFISNIFLALAITTFFGVRNKVIFPSMGVIADDMTYDVLLWCVLNLVDVFLLEYLYVKRYQKENHIIGSFWSVLKHIEIEEQEKEQQKKDESI